MFEIERARIFWHAPEGIPRSFLMPLFHEQILSLEWKIELMKDITTSWRKPEVRKMRKLEKKLRKCRKQVKTKNYRVADNKGGGVEVHFHYGQKDRMVPKSTPPTPPTTMVAALITTKQN